MHYVNADVIAQGLSGFNPDGVALQAGAIMLKRLHDLAAAGKSLGFETTGASRSFAPWLRGLKQDGYHIYIYYFWLPSAEMAMARVAERVRGGGHSVPEETIRRRYELGLRNFFRLYRPLADMWEVVDNSSYTAPRVIARGDSSGDATVEDARVWKKLVRTYCGEV